MTAGMLGLSYFAVPLYRLFCSATGYGGTVSEGRTVEQKIRQRLERPDISAEECAPSVNVHGHRCRGCY
jgi:cytochrome c oxidase assembly protein subunit 11